MKIGLIGCGKVALTRHLPSLQSLSNIEVAAVADVDPACLNGVADRFHIAHRYLDYKDLLNDSMLEAVAICVPASLHVEVALSALQAGKHVFIEKPLSLCLKEANTLILAAIQSRKKIMVGFNLRWHPHLIDARKILDKDSLGHIKLIRFLFTNGIRYQQNLPEWKKRRILGGGVIIENAVHCFDLFRYLFGCDVEEVSAVSHSGEWDDETASITCRMDNGAIAVVEVSECTNDRKELEIYGQTGFL
ncbi:MAG: Gfo/Idh/MocA family oxidoreductase, partial [Desulfoferrobacter sp.]